jgi:hypothetical protein
MLPKPSIQLIEPHSSGLVEVRQEQKRIEIVELQLVAGDSQERCRHGHRNPLVSSTNAWFCERLSQRAAAS